MLRCFDCATQTLPTPQVSANSHVSGPRLDFSTLTTSSSAAPAFASASAAGSPRPSEVVEAGSTLAEVGGACGSSRLSSVSAMGNNNNDVTAATASQLHPQRTWRFSHDRLLQETASSRSKRKNAQRSSRDPRRQWSGGPGGGGGGVGDGRHIAHRCVCVCVLRSPLLSCSAHAVQ